MAAGQGASFRAAAQGSLAFGLIGASYSLVGQLQDGNRRFFAVTNYTDALLQFSFDGIVDHFVVMPYTGRIWDIGSNKQFSQTFLMQPTTGIYVKRIGTPTSGAVYVEYGYAAGD